MPTESLLAHLVPWMTSQHENAATESLAYLLLRYPAVSAAFQEYVSLAGVDLPGPLQMKTQASWQDAARPDLVGLDDQCRQVLVIESKFWAYLMPSQPATYLKRLPAGKPALVLFIAPASRLPTLWPELVQRCGPRPVGGQVQEVAVQFLALHTSREHVLALTSWEALLATLYDKAQQSGNVRAAEEVWQLQGLCARIDAEAFHPLTEQELVSPTALRIVQFRGLADAVVARLVEAGVATTEGYRGTPGAGFYRRYMSLYGSINWAVEFNEAYRKKYPPTNLWLTGSNVPQVLDRLVGLDPICRYGRRLLIPLEILRGGEKEKVIESLYSQIVAVAQRFVD